MLSRTSYGSRYVFLLPVLILFVLTFESRQNARENASSTDASYDVHGTLFGTFPFSPPVRLVSTGAVSHGTLRTFGQFNGFSQDSFIYQANSGYTGADSFTYYACDGAGNCENGTINLNVVNARPAAVDDNYTLHGVLYGGGDTPLTINDSDADGDPLDIVSVTSPTHGRLTYAYEYDSFVYVPDQGFVGADSFDYQICDNLGLCDTGTVFLNVVNSPPVLGDDTYKIRGTTTIGPFLANDTDPDAGDVVYPPTVFSEPVHGSLTNLGTPDFMTYQPIAGYYGPDSFQYEACDYLGLCATATVTLQVLIDDGREETGVTSCRKSVGAPINVTSGNMYLQQTDYLLPGVGPAINVTRTYNSFSPDVGLFGRGWSTVYDESIKSYTPDYIRWFRPDGQATNFLRSSGSGQFTPAEGDFHGALTQNGDGSLILSFRDGSVHRFAPTGKLLSLVDANGNQTTLTYTSGKLSAVTDPFGRTVTTTTDAGGRVLTLADSLGVFATYSYGGSGELLSVSYPDGSKYQFSYTTANGNLVLANVTDALGNVLESHTYDAQGRAVTSERHGGVDRYILSFTGNTETEVTDGLGRVTRYVFDRTKGRNVVTRTEGLCACGGGSQTQSWTYDNQLNVTSHTNGLGQTVSYSYDNAGNQLSGTSVLGTSTFTYNGFGKVLTSTDAMGGVTTYSYDGAGNLLSIEDALNGETSFTYDARGQLLTMRNARGKVTTLAYDPSGNIAQTTDALGNITKFTYDARGRMTSATDALNFKTSYAYDAAGRLNKITQADKSIVSLTYDLAGRLTKIADPLNNVTSFSWDSAYRRIGATDALNKSVSYSYDSMSNLVAATDQLGRTTNVAYDEFNRPTSITYPAAVAGGIRLQESVTYDAAGNTIQRTDTAGRITTFGYDAANRLTTITDPLLQQTRYEYDARSNITAVVDPLNQRYAFEYDALSRVTSATRAGMQMTYAYDAAGNRIRRTDFNNMATNYEYDALNRLTKITYPDSATATYGYDKLSQLISASNINGAVTFVYDKMQRVTSTTDVWGQTVSYTYDLNGRSTQMKLGTSKFATYTYDANNRLTKITDGANKNTSYTYDATGKLLTRTLSNGVVSTYAYDGMDRLTRLVDARGGTLVTDNNYSYDDAGRVVQNTDQGGTHIYGYDVLGRLTSASYPSTGNEAYVYDGVGNRTSSHRSAAYAYQPLNRVASTDTATYLYDNNGNLSSRSDSTGTTSFAWDFENRLTGVVTPAAGAVTYKYDALGRRIQRTPSNGASSNFSYDGADVLRDRNSDGSTVDYLNGAGVDNKIWQKGTAQYFFSQDHLGSTTALTGTNGSVAEREAYDAFGNTGGSALTRYGFTGRERDAMTGLMYYRARWYDPNLGRFISEDPIGLAGGINEYAYVGNDPQNRKDPSGLYEMDVHYYLTYFLAKKTGCFTDDEARLIGAANQASDENPNTSPALGWTRKQRKQNREYHDIKEGNYEEQFSAELWQQALTLEHNYVALGRYLHFLQDSFSHAGYENSFYGHVFALHYFDKTNSDLSRALRMAGATWRALNAYAQAKGCHCSGKWEVSWWQQVIDFSKAPGAVFGAFETIDSSGERENLGMINNRAYLLNKIRILELEL